MASGSVHSTTAPKSTGTSSMSGDRANAASRMPHPSRLDDLRRPAAEEQKNRFVPSHPYQRPRSGALRAEIPPAGSSTTE